MQGGLTGVFGYSDMPQQGAKRSMKLFSEEIVPWPQKYKSGPAGGAIDHSDETHFSREYFQRRLEAI